MASNKNLKQKAASGIIWSAVQKYSGMLIQFISGIILARLLTPYDWGCIGMLAIFVVMAETLIDGGFGSALIQKKRPTQEDYSTVFFWNLGLSVFLYAVLFISAPAIASFYNIPLLCPVLRVEGILLFLYAFNIVQRNQLVKNLRFKILSIVTIVSSITSLTITIIMAYHGYGVWSLVALRILSVGIPALFFWFYVRWRPKWTFSWASFRELFDFGLYVFLTHLINTFCHRIQGLLIGKFYSPSTMGYYSKADRNENMLSSAISSVISQVVYPLYAEVQNDKSRLGNMIRKMTMTLSYLSFPLIMILLLCAKPVFILLYSERWLDSVPYFQVLCIAGVAWCLQAVNTMSIAAIGKSKTMFIWTIVKRIVGTTFIVAGLYLYGMRGLLVGVVLNQWFAYFVNIGMVSRYIGYRWWKQLLDILPTGLVSVSVGIISYYAGLLCQFSLYYDGLLKLTTYLILYLGWSLLFKPDAYNYSISIVTPALNKFGQRLKRCVIL